jgi:hypothetical protein
MQKRQKLCKKDAMGDNIGESRRGQIQFLERNVGGDIVGIDRLLFIKSKLAFFNS